MNTIETMLRQDKPRMQQLQAVQTLQLPDCFVAAGFVRNMVTVNLLKLGTIRVIKLKEKT